MSIPTKEQIKEELLGYTSKPNWLLKLLSILSVISFSLIVSFKAYNKPEPIPEEVLSRPTVDEYLTAITRGDALGPHFKQICYDNVLDGVFILFESTDPNTFNGWYYVKDTNINVWQAANGIRFSKEIDNGMFVKVFPDVTGLTCKVKS
jgi:hypothetical protein